MKPSSPQRGLIYKIMKILVKNPSSHRIDTVSLVGHIIIEPNEEKLIEQSSAEELCNRYGFLEKVSESKLEHKEDLVRKNIIDLPFVKEKIQASVEEYVNHGFSPSEEEAKRLAKERIFGVSQENEEPKKRRGRPKKVES